MPFIGNQPTAVPLASSDLEDNIISTAKIQDNAVTAAKYVEPIPFRNIIINGDMSIAQRGTSTSSITGNGYHTIDRFQTINTSLGTWTQSQSTDVPSGQGFAKSLKMVCTTADASPASSDLLQLRTAFEGQNLQYLNFGTSSAKSLTLSFWVKSNKTGTYTMVFFHRDATKQFSKSYTISSANTWEKKTITVVGNTANGIDNDNAKSFDIWFNLGAGSNFTSGSLSSSWEAETEANYAVGQVNLADNTANEWYITGVQLEAGQTASEFEFLPHDVNRRRCDRYFQRILSDSAYTAFGAGTVYNSTLAPTFVPYRLEMRSSPTFSVSNVLFTQGDSSKGVTSISSTNAGKSSLYIDLNCSSGMTTGRGGLLLASNNSNAYIQMDAEL